MRIAHGLMVGQRTTGGQHAIGFARAREEGLEVVVPLLVDDLLRQKVGAANRGSPGLIPQRPVDQIGEVEEKPSGQGGLCRVVQDIDWPMILAQPNREAPVGILIAHHAFGHFAALPHDLLTSRAVFEVGRPPQEPDSLPCHVAQVVPAVLCWRDQGALPLFLPRHVGGRARPAVHWRGECEVEHLVRALDPVLGAGQLLAPPPHTPGGSQVVEPALPTHPALLVAPAGHHAAASAPVDLHLEPTDLILSFLLLECGLVAKPWVLGKGQRLGFCGVEVAPAVPLPQKVVRLAIRAEGLGTRGQQQVHAQRQPVRHGAHQAGIGDIVDVPAHPVIAEAVTEQSGVDDAAFCVQIDDGRDRSVLREDVEIGQ